MENERIEKEELRIKGLCRIPSSRIIYLNSVITSDIAMVFNLMLLRMENENKDENIRIYINSPGGDVNAGLSMIDTMNLIKPKVSTVCIGIAASMGAMLLMSGEKKMRFALPHSKVIIHQPMGNIGDDYKQASDIIIASNNIKAVREELYMMIHDCTSQPMSKIRKDCERDFILNAEEAIKYGIIDEIIRRN